MKNDSFKNYWPKDLYWSNKIILWIGIFIWLMLLAGLIFIGINYFS